MTGIQKKARCAARQILCSVFTLAVAGMPGGHGYVDRPYALGTFAQDNKPCGDQPRSYSEVRTSFSGGTLPAPGVFSGVWIAIGMFGDFGSTLKLNCSGLSRGRTSDWQMIAKDTVAEIEIPFVHRQTTEVVRNVARNWIEIAVDFDADNWSYYRCRLTKRKTLVCLMGESEDDGGYAVEFTRKHESP